MFYFLWAKSLMNLFFFLYYPKDSFLCSPCHHHHHRNSLHLFPLMDLFLLSPPAHFFFFSLHFHQRPKKGRDIQFLKSCILKMTHYFFMLIDSLARCRVLNENKCTCSFKSVVPLSSSGAIENSEVIVILNYFQVSCWFVFGNFRSSLYP